MSEAPSSSVSTSPIAEAVSGSGAQAKRRPSPFSFFEWMVARRYLGATRSGRGVSLISMIAFGGIMLAVAVLIVVMAVMQGFRAKLLDQLLGLNGHVFVEAFEPITDHDRLAARLSAIPAVKNAAPVIQAPVYITSSSGETGAVVVGISKENLLAREVLTLPGAIRSGDYDSFQSAPDKPDEVIIGTGLSYRLGVRAGDFVQLISGKGAETAFGPTITKKNYRVGAVYSVDNSEFDGLYIFMPLDQAQLFFRYGAGVQKIEMRVDDPDRIDPVLAQIDQAAQGYTVRDWRQIHGAFFNALKIERGMVRIILSLIVAVAALNIITGLIMLVKDKTGDIAVLRTMGATKGAIMRIFFISGSAIGILGTLAGVLLGVVFTYNIAGIERFLSDQLNIDLFSSQIYFFSEVPAEVQVVETVFIVGWALLMSVLSTLYPSWRAAELDPVEALRYE
ncbi:MAG: lipoprotein-releasing ABC transporter permease subunit [Pseudomonadota bacterium]